MPPRGTSYLTDMIVFRSLRGGVDGNEVQVQENCGVACWMPEGGGVEGRRRQGMCTDG